MPNNNTSVAPIEKVSTVHIGDRDFKVISIFEGTETASKLLCDLAVSRILYESKSPASQG